MGPEIRKRLLPGRRLDKKANQHLVLETIRTEEPVSVPEIVRITNLSRPTVDRFVKHLCRHRLIKRGGHGSTVTGRRPILWKLNNRAGYIVGIDIESPHLDLVLTDLELNIVQRSRTNLSVQIRQEELAELLTRSIDQLLTDSGIQRDQLIGMGVGFPGTIDKSRGICLVSERIPKCRGMPLVDLLREEYGVPVLLENDVVLMGIAERTLNKEVSDIQNMVYVGFRTGIGAAIFVGGKSFNGVCGNAGRLGHMVVDKDGPQCTCGNRGCLEVFADDAALVNKARAGIRQGIATRIGSGTTSEEGGITIEGILQAAREGDSFAEGLLAEGADYLGVAIANMVNLLDIPSIILGGQVVDAGQRFLEMVATAVRDRMFPDLGHDLDLRYARVNRNAAAIGAAIVVVQDVFREPSLPGVQAN